MYRLLRPLVPGWWGRVGLVLLTLFSFVLSTSTVQASIKATTTVQEKIKNEEKKLATIHDLGVVTSNFKRMLPIWRQFGVDTTNTETALKTLQSYIVFGKYIEAYTLAGHIEMSLQEEAGDKQWAALRAEEAATQAAADAQKAAAEVERKMATVNGTTKAGVVLSLLQGSQVIATTTSDGAGKYSMRVKAGSYILKATLSGYQTYQKTDLVLAETEQKGLDLTLAPIVVVKTPAPTPKPTANPSPVVTGDDVSTYEYKTISTSRGDFSLHLLTVQVGAGKAKVKLNTASTEDCTNNCPVSNVGSYVKELGGFAGINGTYLCPTDYASCAGKTNSFYYKVFSSKANKMINATNGLGDFLPFITFTSNGSPKWYSSWADYQANPTPIAAGISCRPALVHNGENVLDLNSLDDKERTAKSIRTGLGIKGDTVYVAVVRSATVVDLAEVMKSVGVTDSLNLDGGGSTALYYNGSYKTGPGRGIPNALVFTR